MLYTWKQRKQDFLLLHTEQETSEKKRKNYELNEAKRSQFPLNFVGALFITNPPPPRHCVQAIFTWWITVSWLFSIFLGLFLKTH